MDTRVNYNKLIKERMANNINANINAEARILAFTPNTIRVLLRDEVVAALGLTMLLTNAQRQRCLWQIEFLTERQALLD
jgi:hypothetical protein